MDNLLPIHPNNSKIYITCLKIYENFENFFRLKEKFENFESDKEKESRSSLCESVHNLGNLRESQGGKLSLGSIKDSLNIRKTINYKISSRSTPRNDSHISSVFSKVTDQSENHEHQENNYNTNSLSENQQEKKISLLEEEETLNVTSKLSPRNSQTLLPNKNLYKNFFAPKVLLFVSFYPFRCEQSKILKSIHNYYQINKNRVKKPIEKILENLILETPAPPKGIHNVEFQLFNEKYILSQPGANSLPMVSLEIEKLFSIFKIEQLLDIYKYVLLESKIIFFSSDKNFLSNTIESFLSLLYPLSYYYPTMTILPVDNFSILENFESYIVGVNLKFTETFFKDYNLEIYKNVLVVDIDRKNLIFHAPSASTEMPVTSLEDLKPNSSEKSHNTSFNLVDNSGLNLINLEIPKHLKIKIIDKLKNYIREIKSNTSHKEDRDNFIKHITHIFFSFMISLLVDYHKYLISTDKEFEKINFVLNSQSKENNYRVLTIYDLFKVEDFLNYSIHYLDKPFYRRLIETKMFFNLIYKKLFPKTNKEKLEIVHFDECIILKNNKKIFAKSLYTPFILSKHYDIKNTYTVPKARMFSRSEIDQLSKQENMKKALRYGQEIYLENQDKAGITLLYHIFPKLLYDEEFFIEKIESQFLLNNIQIKTNLNNESESINFEVISNQQLLFIYLNTNYSLENINKMDLMENYIYLSWIESFAVTFHYCEFYEKPYRFQQLLNVIKKLNWIDEETLNLIFVAILEFGDDMMAIKLYDIFTSKNLLNNYTTFSNLVCKLSPKESFNAEQFQNLPNKKRLTCSSRRSNINLIHVNSMFNIQLKPDYKFKRRTLIPISQSNTNELKNLNLNFYEERIGQDPEEILFETEDNCMECQRVITVDTMSLDFRNMKRESLWAQCPHCSNFIIPKLGVKIDYSKNEGRNCDYDSYSRNEETTFNYTKICLYSPYYLKENFKLAILKESGLKLDLKDFMKRYCALFWNLIWYYSLMELPFDFLLPYKQENLSSNPIKNNHEKPDTLKLDIIQSSSNLIDTERHNFYDSKLNQFSKPSKTAKIIDENEKENILIKQPSTNSNFNSNNFSNSKVMNNIDTPPKMDNIVVSSGWLNITPSSEFLIHDNENKTKSLNINDLQNFSGNEKLRNTFNTNEMQVSKEIENFVIFGVEYNFVNSPENSLKTKDFYSSNPEIIELENVDKSEQINFPQSARHLRMNSNSCINPLLLADSQNFSNERHSERSNESHNHPSLEKAPSKGKMSFDSPHINKSRLYHEYRNKFGKNNSVDVNSHAQKIKFKENNEEFFYHKDE